MNHLKPTKAHSPSEAISLDDLDIIELSEETIQRLQAGGKVFTKEWFVSVMAGILL